MKFNENYRPEECAGTDILRKALTYVQHKDGRLIATDRHVLCSLPVEDSEGQTEELISMSTIKAARVYLKEQNKGKAKDARDHTIIVEEKEEIQERFPRCELIIDPLKQREHTYTIALDPALLVRLAKAMGCDTLRLHFGEPKEAIYVTPNDPQGDEFGVCMPCRMDE